MTVAKLDGQSIEIASLPNLPATICYVKLVPLTEDEVSKWTAQQNATDSKTRTSIATFDGHSWIWPYQCRTANDLLANFRGYEGSDIGKWWFQVLGADLETKFLKEVRTLLDEKARGQGRKQRYKISLGTFSTESDNQKFGLDLPLWIQKGLVDDLAIAWFAITLRLLSLT